MLSIAKVVELNAWETRRQGRQGSERARVVSAMSVDRDDVEFAIEIHRTPGVEACSITLKGKIHPRPFQAICRYDVHDTDHQNPRGSMPETVESGAPHRHLYREEHDRKRNKWDVFAEPIRDASATSAERLLGAFVCDMNIRFQDQRTNTELFGFMKT